MRLGGSVLTASVIRCLKLSMVYLEVDVRATAGHLQRRHEEVAEEHKRDDVEASFLHRLHSQVTSKGGENGPES